MKINLICIGQQMPTWIQTGYQEYCKRMPKACQLVLHELPMPKRTKNIIAPKLKQQEAKLIQKAIPNKTYMIALDEHGKDWSTRGLAQEMQQWLQLGLDISLIIGGPDGLDNSILETANAKRSLSQLTLPHPFVRIILAEQLYRAWSLLNNHPYHRD
ncbi:MAG: 23S rRNA (pseudouridine(1915)-N(3))-methyltransferase RlmH [Legionellales bacterium]|nr:23S rRNA (pseudouridine(1915)-N(3))-methyltransferase RlmH [Legionellales bacterium]|tara:strand:- start:6 stop:476 length:471 start_codon:yes stop_codon:yes gene_type:complete